MLDPFYLPKLFVAMLRVVFPFWIRLLGPKLFWGLMGLSTGIMTIVIACDSIG